MRRQETSMVSDEYLDAIPVRLATAEEYWRARPVRLASPDENAQPVRAAAPGEYFCAEIIRKATEHEQPTAKSVIFVGRSLL